MTQADAPSGVGPIEHAMIRWSIPAIYGCCLLCVLLGAWSDYRRVAFAKEVAGLIRKTTPEDLSELLAVLGDRVSDVRQYQLFGDRQPWVPVNPQVREVRAVEHSEEAIKQLAHIDLRPDLWLHLAVSLEPGPSGEAAERIKSIGLAYAGSEEVSLDTPEQDLPGPPAWHWWAIIIVMTLLPSRIWLSANRNTRLSWRDTIGAIVAGLPLLLYVPFALITLARMALTS